MVKITRTEAKYMRKNGYAEFVKKSHTKNPTYYLVEEQDNVYNRRGRFVRLSALNALKQYRESHIVYSSDNK